MASAYKVEERACKNLVVACWGPRSFEEDSEWGGAVRVDLGARAAPEGVPVVAPGIDLEGGPGVVLEGDLGVGLEGEPAVGPEIEVVAN